MDYNEYVEWQDEGSATMNQHFQWIEDRMQWFLSHTEPRLPKESKILVVGFRDCYEMSYLNSHGYKNLVGIDISRRMVAIALLRSKFDVRWDDIENPRTLGIGEYDYILMSHVIEHTRVPLDALHSCMSRLKWGGKLYLVVPQESEQLSKYHTIPFREEGDITSIVKESGFRITNLTFIETTNPKEWLIICTKGT